MTHTEDQTLRRRILGRFAHRAWIAALALGVSVGLTFIDSGSDSLVNTGSDSQLQPGDVIKTDFLRNWETGRCLTADPNFKILVRTEPCGSPGDPSQTWSLVYSGHIDSGDTVQIKNQSFGLCLFYDIFNSRTTIAGKCMGDLDSGAITGQHWVGIGEGWDKVELRNTAVGTALDSTAAGAVGLNPPNGGGNQKWKSGF
ncbi:hypothetical protein ABZ896_01680 [Streptomyces sp. NPDC047072]|uniref:RICIN domain-containing protein n=1 Tax=Streptomyces sp. NPDC047072 TaxID=3154809 RepID=UPI0033DEF82F